MNRDPSGRFAPVPRYAELQRYLRDPAYRAQLDAERDREQQRLSADRDLGALANYRPENFDEEPGFVSVLRERVAAYDGSAVG